MCLTRLGYHRPTVIKVLYELVKKPLDIEKIKKFVEYDDECKAAFLRGFFDSEGCISKNGDVTVYNTDLKLLGYVRQLIESLEIGTTGPHLMTKHGTSFRDTRKGKTYETRKNAYNLYVPAGFRLKFYKWMGFTIRRKQRRLQDYLIRTGRLKPLAKLSLFFQLCPTISHFYNIACPGADLNRRHSGLQPDALPACATGAP